jgi:hypothetical protein
MHAGLLQKTQPLQAASAQPHQHGSAEDAAALDRKPSANGNRRRQQARQAAALVPSEASTPTRAAAPPAAAPAASEGLLIERAPLLEQPARSASEPHAAAAAPPPPGLGRHLSGSSRSLPAPLAVANGATRHGLLKTEVQRLVAGSTGTTAAAAATAGPAAFHSSSGHAGNGASCYVAHLSLAKLVAAPRGAGAGAAPGAAAPKPGQHRQPAKEAPQPHALRRWV